VNILNIDFEKVIDNLRLKATAIYEDRDKIWELLNKTKEKLEQNEELKSLFDDVRLLIELIKDYNKGEYTGLSKNSIILVIISLIYLVSPLDIIPDFLVGGFLDDATVIAFILKKIEAEITAYKSWKSIEKEDNDDNMIEITLDHDDEI
jgi:uncharacterized membrane protein YkvA (DUF1232 family)